MNERLQELDSRLGLGALLGYLNFSTGKPDPRFQQGWNRAWSEVARDGSSRPWHDLPTLLLDLLAALNAQGQSPFQDVTQAHAVLLLARDQVQAAYRAHHADLLSHASDAQLWQPFLVLRVLETLLSQGGPWDESERLIAVTLRQLNDYVGHRPIAVLETRPRGEPYPHERYRPLPIYLRSVGVATHSEAVLFEETLRILRETPTPLLEEFHLDLDLLDEWALDIRAYDHQLPTNRRPNYVFGEWDPHHLDGQGRFRRFVTRQVILDALVERLRGAEPAAPEERLFEAAAVLAGTVLMGASISGSSPTTFPSTLNLGMLVPKIARLRDEFYTHLLNRQSGARGDRLREEAALLRQPFGAARQHLNHTLASLRAHQLQERRVAKLLASLGHEDQRLRTSAHLAAPTIRIPTEMLVHINRSLQEVAEGSLDAAAERIPLIEDLLERGVACGALPDPWNILGFQGMFPLFQSAEDSIHDNRLDELLDIMEGIFNVYARLLSAAATVERDDLTTRLLPRLHALAEWWDRFATTEVSDLESPSGAEWVEVVERVGQVLRDWRSRGETAADLAFWRRQIAEFTAPQAYALVLDALLSKQDFQAAMGLLVSWLSQAETVPLEDGEDSFQPLALRWLACVLDTLRRPKPGDEPWTLVRKFFDFLEANADEYWRVPRLASPTTRAGPTVADETGEEHPFSAAYEGMTYRDSTDDDVEGSVADESPMGAGRETAFPLESEGERIGQRLRFLALWARLWQLTGRQALRGAPRDLPRDALAGWLTVVTQQQQDLLLLLDELHAYPVPEPVGSYESLVEFDQQRLLKERTIEAALAAGLDLLLAERALRTALLHQQQRGPIERASDWPGLFVQIEFACSQRQLTVVKALLPLFLRSFQNEPLLYAPLDAGGHPHDILKVRTAQLTLRELLQMLPRLGLLQQTHRVLRLARDMEQRKLLPGRQITEFNHLFQTALQAVVAAVVESAEAWQPSQGPAALVQTLETLTWPFLLLWMDHSQSVRLSSLEGESARDHEDTLIKFIRTYGSDLFTPKFMTLANLRGILNRGVEAYLAYLDEEEPREAQKLLADFRAGRIGRAEVAQHLAFVLRAIVENYEEYKDYNATTTQSDYGENLFRLLSFLKLKANYDRNAWNFRPVVWAHEILCRLGQFEAAALWRENFQRRTNELALRYQHEAQKLRQTHRMALRSITDALEGGFLMPLDQDRLAALIEPVLAAERPPERAARLAAFKQELEPFLEKATGIGLDAPGWLKGLEAEVERVQDRLDAVGDFGTPLFWLPRVQLSFAEIQQQIQEWDRGIEPENLLE